MVVATLEVPPLKKPRGQMMDLLQDLRHYKGERKVWPILIEGPRGSAKTRLFTAFMFETAMHFAGMKILVVRKTRADLAATWCKSFEEEIIPPHLRASIIGDARSTNRTEYALPNGSEFMLVGLDRPSKSQGANLDVVLGEEIEEVQWSQVQGFYGALRRWTGKIPWQLFVGLTNPGPPKHWANEKAKAGEMRRVVTTHKDNPKFWDEDALEWTPEGKAYMDGLSHYTGVQYRRHVLGEWAGSDAMVWENFSELDHVIDSPRRSDNSFDWGRLGLKDYIGAMDWGYTAPGALLVFGRDGDKRLVRVAEIYRTKQQLEWWAERVIELDQEFGLTRIMCDPSRPDAIALVNDHLSRRGLPRLCEPADNTKAASTKGDLSGLDLVRWGLEKDEQGIPRIRFCRDGLRFGPDLELLEANQPIDVLGEIPGYVFARDAQGEILDDRTDDSAPDHSADCVRYACSENWKRSKPSTLIVPKFKRGTLGAILDHRSEYVIKRRVRI